jgi:hypothetical protein
VTRRRAWFNETEAELIALDMGMFASYNLYNAGDGRLWDHDLNPGTADSRIVGTGLGQEPWLVTPDELREMADAIWDHPRIPGFGGYIYAGATSETVPYVQYETRSDYVSALDYFITKCASRNNFTGYRTPKS